MAHAGEAPGNNTNANADAPQGFRSISDRGLIFDAANAHSLASYSGQSLGATGLTYAFFDTLGPVSNPSGLDIVHLGSRCAGFAPATIYAYEAAANTGTNLGIAPSWSVCNQSGTPGVSVQTTTISPGVAIDPNTEIGLLYHGSDGGGQINVVLGFSDGTSLPAITIACPDWFGSPADPAIVANQPITSQTKLRHTEGTTAFVTFQGAQNVDAPRIGAWSTTNGGPNLNVVEAVISVPMIVTGVGGGAWPAHPEVVGKTLTSIAFLDAGGTLTYPPNGRGYAIFAATVRTGQPTNASCSTPQTVVAGDIAATNVRTFGAPPSGCGNNDSSAVWFRYVATGNTVVDARTCGVATTFDTTIAVYTACGGQPIACDDNSCATGSLVQWSAAAGTQYFIRVAGNNGATGSFTLHINDPAHIDVPIPLACNFNGICHGSSEQTLPANSGTTYDNRCDLNGYRSIADKGLLCDGVAANSLNIAGTFGYQGLRYSVISTPGVVDIVHLGNRLLAANSTRPFTGACPTGTNGLTGLTPSWLGNVDQTGPQTTVVSSLNAVFGASTSIGILYHASNVDSVNTLATFDAILSFSDSTSIAVTIQATDWAGPNGQTLPGPVAGSGLDQQRVLGLFHAIETTDQAIDSGTTVKVDEAVISTSSLMARGFNPSGKTLASITFSNPRSGNAAHDSTYSGFAIFAATLRDPASYNPNYGPGGTGNAAPNPIVAGRTGLISVNTTRGTGSPNAITTVIVDASSIGLSSTLALNDSGTGGDIAAHDNVWSASLTPPFAAPTGPHSLPFALVDAQNRTATGSIPITVNAPAPGDDRRPATPTITEPALEGQVINASDLHMVTANMISPVGANHLCSDWEIYKIGGGAGGADARVWSATCVSIGSLKVHIHLGDGVFEGIYAGRTILEYDTSFYYRVRHRDDSGDPVSEYSYWATRHFRSAPPTQIFPYEEDDLVTSPVPVWQVDGVGAEVLPAGASMILGSVAGDLLLRIDGSASGNQLTNPAALTGHVNVRVTLNAPAGAPLSIAPSTITVVDHDCNRHAIYLPAISLAAGGQALYWVTTSGSTYVAAAGQSVPVFATLARSTLSPWELRQPGYVVEQFASNFQLPVNIAFVPSPGPNPSDIFFYVTELYGQIMMVTRDGTVSVYATGLLNYPPTGVFPGSGESGVTGVAVEPTTGDLFVTMLYSLVAGDPTQLRPRIVRMHSTDGGRTMASMTVLVTFPTEPQGQSHQISNITIGPDNKLYVHMGDGFDQTKGQDLTSARGKILRLNFDGSSPTDNPFYNGTNPRSQVWLYGIRNPFGGGWRASDGKHFTIENGPSNDRITIGVPGQNYLYDGSDTSMANFNLIGISTNPLTSIWYPAHGPVNVAFTQTATFNGSGFPPAKMDHAFVTESGPTYGQGAQTLGKRISEFVFAPNTGTLISGPAPIVEYTGAGFASCVGIAAGPDGLYFSELYKDLNTTAPNARGANILRIRYVGVTGACPSCAADFNGVNGLEVSDIFDFLSAWFAGDPRGDFNAIGGINVQDIFDFLAAWFAGC